MSKTGRSVNCKFHHVPSDAVDSISSSIELRTNYNKNEAYISCSCSPAKANQIRSKLSNVLRSYRQIWFSADLPTNSASASMPFNKNIGNDIHVSFGSILSTSQFLIHEISFRSSTQWTMAFCNQQTLVIKSQDVDNTRASIHFTLSMRFVDKNVLVVENDTYSYIIFNMNKIKREVRENDGTKSVRLDENHAIIESLARCSEILLRISPKADADQFIDYLRIKHDYQIFYTIITIEQDRCKPWDNMEFNWYPTSEAVYAVSMLHSLGYLFDDKYLNNKALQTIMVEFAEENDKRFYQLALKAFIELQKCHWLDLTTIFNRDQFNRIKITRKDHLHYVGVVHLTPTRLHIMPKETTEGHRAMRLGLFQGANNFCLLYLKPDPPDMYLNENTEYFQKIFESGVEIGRERFHLLGSSNSQIKEHTYWFVKATSLDDIHEKRLQLGELNRIENLGTYVARLGLWFSTSSPTGIKLIYCSNEREFKQRVQRREICVMCIDDIERNDYCFTDGNGFISKGLAKCVTGKLPVSSKTSQANNIPSAYQIRMAGCKGLLIIDPQSTSEQFYIKIRPSMKKFECNDWTLDICEYSQSTPTRLNNQIILLMSDLGVPDETFFHLQQRWFNETPSRSNSYECLLKNKIPLPVNECRFMYGCAFQTQLRSGTCLIRYQVLDHSGDAFPTAKFECVKGRVIVTKNPCPYAGDMLVLEAVDIPELHDLHDVIVFSTEGERPDFHKIAGSDLDGDKYFVYWGNEFQLQCSVPPLEYAAEKKIKHPTAITPLDVIKYYLSTLGATSYGEIYNLHAVIVDKNSEQHRQRTCQKLAIDLARMFASAIDSGKTGYVIDKEHIRKIREQYGQTYPDFLMKYGKSYYKSQSIIGQLYRHAVLYKKGNIDDLNHAFAQLGIGDNRLHVSSPTPLSSRPVNIATEPAVKKTRCKSAKKPTK